MRELQPGSDAASSSIGHLGPPGESDSNVPSTDDWGEPERAPH